MSIRINQNRHAFDPAAATTPDIKDEAPRKAASTQHSAAAAEPSIAKRPVTPTAPLSRPERSLRNSGNEVNRAGHPHRFTVSGRQRELEADVITLRGAEQTIDRIKNTIPRASDAVSLALPQLSDDEASYAELSQEFGPQWMSNSTAKASAADGWLPLGERIEVVDSDHPHDTSQTPEAGDWLPLGERIEVVDKDQPLGTPAASLTQRGNDADDDLPDESFASRVIANYNAAQERYWSTEIDGVSRSETLQRAMRSAVKAEAGIRLRSRTLSATAHRVIEQLWLDPNRRLSDLAPRMETSRLTVDGEDVAGAFVISGRRAGAQEAEVAMLWRPGRPLQEFSSVDDLRQWVADEHATTDGDRRQSNVEAVGTRVADGNIFALRVQDLRAQMERRLADGLELSKDADSLKDYLDNSPIAEGYLDLSRAWDGDATESMRRSLSGPDAPLQILNLEEARQTAFDSTKAIQSRLESIPSLGNFAADKIKDYLAKVLRLNFQVQHPATT